MLKRLISRHLSFFVMALASASLYVSNVALARALTPTDYGFYALLISFVSIVASFGFGGVDQAVVRTARIEGGVILVSPRLLVIALISSIIFSFFAYFYFISFGLQSAVLAVISTAGVAVGLAGYSWGRLRKSFVFAQFSHGGHRFVLGIIVFVSWIFGLPVDIKVVELAVAVSSLLVALYVILYFFRFRDVVLSPDIRDSVMVFAAGYSVSMFLMNSIGFADRFFVEAFFGIEAAAVYFFYANIYVFPFSLLQGYVGFRELSSYKERFSIKVLNKDLLRAALVFISVLVLCVAADYLLTTYFLPPGFEITVYERILLACLGGARILYGSLSAAFGAVASSGAIHRVNLATVSAGALSLASFVYVFDRSLVILIACFLFVWIVRATSIYFMVCKGRSDAV